MGALHSDQLLPQINGVSVIADCDKSSSSSSSDEECAFDGEVISHSSNQENSLVKSVAAILHALGEDLSRNGLLKTPSRVSRALLTATKGYHLSAEQIIGGALFTESGLGNGQGGGCGGMVVVRNTELFSTCESCLLPFKVCCHIAYIPSAHRVVGLSKLPRVAEIFAARLQNPERLANEIAQALSDGFRPLGVAVVAECWHLQCRSSSSDQDTTSAETISSSSTSWIRGSAHAKRGKFVDADSEDWSEFLGMLRIAGVQSGKKPFQCPFVEGLLSSSSSLDEAKVDLESMVEAVRSLLRTLGEDPERDELKLTPLRYARWLVSSTQGSRGPLSSSSFILNGGLISEAEEEHVEVVLDLPFCSQCEHHLLPFTGVAHVGFSSRASEQRIERDFVQRIVKVFSCRLQVQERLTRQIAEALMSSCGSASGVMVVVEASHVCMISRGVRKPGTSTATLATLGKFASDGKARSQFLQRIDAAERKGNSSRLL